MKKLLSVILAVYITVMSMCSFVACGTIDTPNGGDKKPEDEQTETYYAYDPETDEYEDGDYITIQGTAAAWHWVDVALGDMEFDGTVSFVNNSFTITLNGEFSAADTCLMTYKGKKESDGVLRVDSTVITRYSELVNPTVTTDVTVRYFCKKDSKPANPVLPPEPDNQIDGTYYEYNPEADEYFENGYIVIDGSSCNIIMEIDGDEYTLIGTCTYTNGEFVMDCSAELMGVTIMRVVNKGSAEKPGVLHIMRTEMYAKGADDIIEDTSDYFCLKGVKPDNPVVTVPIVVTFDGNGGTFDGKKSVEVNVGDKGRVTLPQEPKRTGFVFNGYNLKNTGTDFWIDEYTPFVKDTTVYAMWVKEVTVKFYSDGKLVKTKNVGQGMELGEMPYLSPTDNAMLKGWFDGTKQYNSYSKVDGDLTLYAEWLTEKDINEYNESVWQWTKPGHLYIHYLRHDHNALEEGTSQPNTAAPNYSTPIDSKTYWDWALWAWPKGGVGRAFYPMHIDMSGAVYDIDLSYTFTDCSWDAENKAPLNQSAIFNTQEIGMQLFMDSSRYGDSVFWVNDGGDNYISQSFIEGQHVYVTEGNVRSSKMTSRMVLNVAYNPYG